MDTITISLERYKELEKKEIIANGIEEEKIKEFFEVEVEKLTPVLEAEYKFNIFKLKCNIDSRLRQISIRDFKMWKNKTSRWTADNSISSLLWGG